MLEPVDACLIGLGLAGVAVLFSLSVAIFGGERITMSGFYQKIAGKWPYIIGVATPIVVGAHDLGYLSDAAFQRIAILGGAGGVASLRGALKTIVADAIARKVAVQLAPVEPEPIRRTPPLPSRRPAETAWGQPDSTMPTARPLTPQAAGATIYEEHDAS